MKKPAASLLVLPLLALAVAASPASAQDAPAAPATPPAAAAPSGDAAAAPGTADQPAPEQVPLTADSVKGFLDSWPELQKLGDEFAEKYGVDEAATDPITTFSAWAENDEAKARIDAVLSKHGFASLADWAKVANSVMIAYTYDPAELTHERLAEALAEVEKAQDIPAEQKAEIAASVKEQFAAARAMQPPPGNTEVVKPFAERIAEVMGDSSDTVPGEDEPADPAPAEPDAPADPAAPPQQ
jgi:hypothetical protein